MSYSLEQLAEESVPSDTRAPKFGIAMDILSRRTEDCQKRLNLWAKSCPESIAFDLISDTAVKSWCRAI